MPFAESVRPVLTTLHALLSEVINMGKFTEEDINRILNLRGSDGKLIDVFDLHGVIFIGNTQPNKKGKEEWDLTKTYKRHSEHSLGISIEDFEDCNTEDEVSDTFSELLSEVIQKRLS